MMPIILLGRVRPSMASSLVARLHARNSPKLQRVPMNCWWKYFDSREFEDIIRDVEFQDKKCRELEKFSLLSYA